jgi:hypothetical protein
LGGAIGDGPRPALIAAATVVPSIKSALAVVKEPVDR